ncbi:TonB-dependent receptor domain-containing protein, partial [Steroidobacter sp.]|uniref:TonB-dependent receptor domain-containing protein n=1 Tax=Steroidobacter sp. TaxID=1978227 RepID=UPI001A52C1D0
ELPNDWQMETDYTWTSNVNRQGSAQFYSSTVPLAMYTGALNPFVDSSVSTLNLSPYRGNAWGRFPSSLDNMALRVAGPIWQLPAGSPTLAIGLERRKESMEEGPYRWNYPTLPVYSLNRTYRGQSQTVLSAYAELKVPLVSSANSVPFVRELDLQLAGRTEHFKVSTGTSYIDAGTNAAIVNSEVTYSSTNPTIGLRFKPFDGIMLRASYATGFLPPDFGQFMAPILGGGDSTGPNATRNVIDPLRGNQVTAVNFIAGGNPDIEPQSSTSWSLGLVWEPAFVEGLRASVDWYRLKLKDVAVTPTPQQIVNLERLYPNRVRRAAASPGDPYGVGQLTLVDFSLLNANEMSTEGVDFTLSYRFGAGSWGNFQLAAMGTTIRSFERQTAIGTPLVDVVNDVADNGPLKHKGNLSATWVRGAWKADWMVSYFGSYNQYDTGGLTTYVLAQGSRTVPSQTYHDAVLEYRWQDESSGTLSDRLLSGTTVQLGISNVFDKTPPFDAYYNFNNYISPFGDARLREYWLSLTKRF